MPQHFQTGERPEPVRSTGSKEATEATLSPEDTAARAAVEDYLDRVCLPLVEELPYGARTELRREVRQHLTCLIDAYAELGEPPLRATRNALAKFGEPEAVARLWASSFGAARRGKGRGAARWLRRQWPGMTAGAAALGALTAVLCLAGVLVRPAPRVAETGDGPSLSAAAPAFSHAAAVQTLDCMDCHRPTERSAGPGAQWADDHILARRIMVWQRETAARRQPAGPPAVPRNR